MITNLNLYKIYENVNISTDAFVLKNLLKNKFRDDIYIEHPSDELFETIEIKIKDDSIVSEFKKILDENNWYISKSYDTSYEIQSVYSKKILDKMPEKLYHATDIKNVEVIERNGLIPKSEDLRNKYPNRIYFTSDIKTAEVLSKEIKKWKKLNSKYTIYEIDTNGLEIVLYYDISCAYKGCFYTDSKIPVGNIKNLHIEI